MEGLKSFLESFKEFIWDIVGYMLPGAYCLILLIVSVNHNYWIDLNNIKIGNNGFVWIMIIVSYLLGYLIYSFNAFWEKLPDLGKLLKCENLSEWIKRLEKKTYSKRIAEETKSRSTYKIAKKILEKKFKEQDIEEEMQNASVRDLRNIAMGLFPKQDQKIYTFQFRADISNSVGTISLIIGIVALLCTFFNNSFVVNDAKHILLYIFLIIVYFLLKPIRNKFYAISINLPFSLLCSNLINEHKNIQNNEK
jgi:hypothetical protein